VVTAVYRMDAVAVETFWRDGYVILRGLLDPTVYEHARSLSGRTVQRKFQSQVLPLRPAADPHDNAPLEERWARVARELVADVGVDSDNASTVVKAGTWGRHDMLDPCVYELLARPELLDVVRAILGPELTANGDWWFRPAVSEKIGVHWGYPYHQDSYFYGGSVKPGDCQIVSLWLPLVDVDERSGCLQCAAPRISRAR
jgi:hypothetical protein